MKGKLFTAGTVGVLGAFAILYSRGTSCGALPAAVAGEGAECALVCNANGGAQAQCAMEVDMSPREVEAVITSYDRFPMIFQSTLWEIEKFDAVEAEASRYRASGTLWSVFGSYPIDIAIKHERVGDVFRAVWAPGLQSPPDQNAGAWEISPNQGKGTHITYTLAASARPFPQFLVNDALLFELPEVLELAARELAKKRGGNGS